MNQFVVDNGDVSLFTRSVFDPNELNHQTCATRQPSYLQAVGASSEPSAVFDSAKELHEHSTHRSLANLTKSEFGMSRQHYVPMQAKDVSNMDFRTHISPGDERLPIAADSRGNSLTCIQNGNRNHPGPGFVNVKSNHQSDINYHLSEMAPGPKAKHPPRAVVAPMSQTGDMERPYPIDRFSSLPKMLKPSQTGNKDVLKDYLDTELSTSRSYGTMVPTTNTAYRLVNEQSLGSGHRATFVQSKPLFTSEHSGIVSEHVARPHPSHCSIGSNDAEKSKIFDDGDDGHSYIHPHTVESVLNYQNMTRKSSERRKAANSRVTTGNSMPAGGFNDANRNLAYTGARPNCWPSNEMVSTPFPLDMPLERKHEGDRRSASSASTTCSSQIDSGYSGDRCCSVSLTSTCQSPEQHCDHGLDSQCSHPLTGGSFGPRSVDVLCQGTNWASEEGFSTVNDLTTLAGQSHFSYPGQVRTVESPECRPQHHYNRAEIPQSMPVLYEAHSVMQKEAPSARRPHRPQLNTNADVASSRSEYRNNHHLNMSPEHDRELSGAALNTIREPIKVKQMMAGECGSKPSVENTTEQTRYLIMLQKQIKLYRVKDEATRRLEDTSAHSSMFSNAVCIPTTQTDRNTVQSSCFNLETVSQDSEFNSCVVKPCSAKANRGSMNFNRLHQLERDGNVLDLISKKKALERKRVGLGTVDSKGDGQGTSIVRPDSVTYHNSADPGFNDVQRMQVNPVCSGKVIGERGTNSQQLVGSMKFDAAAKLTSSELLSSAEDIVNVWTLMKNERKSQLKRDANLALVAPPIDNENWKSSFEKTDVENLQVSAVVPTFHDNRGRSGFENHVKKSVSFSDNVALIASTEEVPSNNQVDYVEYVTSFLRKRTNGLKSYEATDDRISQTDSSSRGSLLSESRTYSSGSRSNSDVSMPESAASSGDQDSDFYEIDGSMCSEEDSEGTTVDETGRIRCSLCHKRWIDMSEIFCKDCSFYMSKFQQEA